MRAPTRLVTDDHGAEGLYRRCSECRAWKPADREHFYGTGSGGLTGMCKPCKRADTAAQRAFNLSHPETRAEYLRRSNEASKRWRQRNPEKWRRIHRESQRRYEQRKRTDINEKARIDHRLRAERQGRTVRPYGKHATAAPYIQPHGGRADPLLDPRPLREWLETVIAREVHGDDGLRGLCRELGWQDRQLWAVRNGEYATVSLHTADRLLTAYGRPVVIRSRDLERRLTDWAQSLPGNGERILRYMDRAEAVGHLADVAVSRLEDLWPSLGED